MKKTRFIALVLAVSLMIMGSGFAYWTDTLVINSEVKTGKFDVNFIKKESGQGWNKIKTPEVKKIDSEFMGATIDVDGKKATIDITDMYPEGFAKFKVTVKNEGTLPARYTGVGLKHTGGSKDLFTALNVEYSFDDKTYFSDVADLASKPGPEKKEIVIDTEDTKNTKSTQDFYIKITMDKEVKNLEENSTKMVLTMDWEQYIKR